MREYSDIYTMIKSAAELDRVSTVRSLDPNSGTLLFVPDLPKYHERDFVHGPQIVAAVSQAIRDQFGFAVKGVRNLHFREPTTRNNTVLVTPISQAVPARPLVSGTLDTNMGELHFGVLADPEGFKSDELVKPHSRIPVLGDDQNQIYRRPDGSYQMRITFTPEMGSNMPLFVSEAAITLGYKLIDEPLDSFVEKTSHTAIQRGMYSAQSYLQKIDGLSFKDITPNRPYIFQMKITEIVDRGLTRFVNCKYQISTPEGALCSNGNVSFGIKVEPCFT